MMTGFERYTKKTRRAMFLEEMEQVAGSRAPYDPRAGCRIGFPTALDGQKILMWKSRDANGMLVISR